MPGVDLLLHYDRRWLRPDLLAALSLWAVLVPQSLAYAQLAGLPAVVGLYGALAAMTAYALLGASRYLDVGPESSVAVLATDAAAPSTRALVRPANLPTCGPCVKMYGGERSDGSEVAALEADGRVSEQLSAAVFRGGVAVAIVATVLSLGMTFPVAQLLAPLRRVRLVVAMLILNTVVLPAAAWGVATTVPISDGYVAGISLAAIGSAGAAGLKAAQLSRRADLPLAVGLVVVLQLANLVAVPLWAAVVVTGASLSRLTILQSLLALVLLPLVLGTVVPARSADLAARLRPVLLRVGNLALVVGLAAGIAANGDVLLSVLGSWVLPAALAIVGLGLGLGLLVGRTDGPTRVTTSLVSGTRFSALGLIIVGIQFPDRPEYLASAITFSLADFVVMLGAALAIQPDAPWRRRPSG